MSISNDIRLNNAALPRHFFSRCFPKRGGLKKDKKMSRKKSAKERRLTGIEVPVKKGVSGSGKIFTPPNLTKTQAAIWERLIDSIDTKALLEIDSYTLSAKSD
jgi:hypothetical protein